MLLINFNVEFISATLSKRYRAIQLWLHRIWNRAIQLWFHDNDYVHHHHRDDNGDSNVTTGTVPVLDRSPTSSSYNSRICCSVCGRYQG
jgi:hypothetical protein